MKYKALSLLPLAAALAACAGGGVAEPHIPVSIPTATPLPTGEVKLSDDNSKIENINTAGTGSTSGISIQQREVEKEPFPGYKTKETSFIFQTPGGAQYALSSYADPITVSYSSPDFKIPDRHAGQRLADGSRIFICCSESGATSYAEITKQDYMKFRGVDRSQRRNRPLRRRLPRRQNAETGILLERRHARNRRQGQNHLSGLGHPRQRRAICYFLLYAAEKQWLYVQSYQHPRPFLYHRQFQQ